MRGVLAWVREVTDTPAERRAWYAVAMAVLTACTTAGIVTESVAAQVTGLLVAVGSLVVATAHVPQSPSEASEASEASEESSSTSERTDLPSE